MSGSSFHTCLFHTYFSANYPTALMHTCSTCPNPLPQAQVLYSAGVGCGSPLRSRPALATQAPSPPPAPPAAAASSIPAASRWLASSLPPRPSPLQPPGGGGAVPPPPLSTAALQPTHAPRGSGSGHAHAHSTGAAQGSAAASGGGSEAIGRRSYPDGAIRASEVASSPTSAHRRGVSTSFNDRCEAVRAARFSGLWK